MPTDLVYRLNDRLEKARAAHQFAKQCKQRAAVLIFHAELLLRRFDEVEYRTLLKEAANRQRFVKTNRVPVANSRTVHSKQSSITS